MARVTVEDCIDKVKDRFELVAVAGQRARDIANGSELTIDRNGEKNTVIALREIAAGNVDVAFLRDELVENSQTERRKEDISDDEVDALGASDNAVKDDSPEALLQEAMRQETEADQATDAAAGNDEAAIDFGADDVAVDD